MFIQHFEHFLNFFQILSLSEKKIFSPTIKLASSTNWKFHYQLVLQRLYLMLRKETGFALEKNSVNVITKLKIKSYYI